MKKGIFGLLLLGWTQVSAQIFTPDVSALPDGQLTEHYSEYVLATIPTSTTVSGADVSAMLIQQFPPLILFITEINGMSIPLRITSVEFEVAGLPDGLIKTCTPSLCRFDSTTTGSLVFSGTPNVTGDFVVNITSYTRGILNLAQILSLSGTPIPGVPTEFTMPQGLNTLYDKNYTLHIDEAPSGIADGNTTAPVQIETDQITGDAYLSLNAIVGDQATIVVVDMMGSVVLNLNTIITQETTNIKLPLKSSSANMYVVQASIAGQSCSTKFFHQ